MKLNIPIFFEAVNHTKKTKKTDLVNWHTKKLKKTTQSAFHTNLVNMASFFAMRVI